MDPGSIQPVLDWLNQNREWVAVALILVAFFESVAVAGVVIPGVVLLFGISAIAGGGVLDLFPALVCAFTGAILGDCLSFFLGKAMKQRVRTIWPFRIYPEWITDAERFVGHHGGKSVVVGRFVGPIRPVVPMVAGMLDMPSVRFVVINILSALAWAPTYVLPGYLVGASIRWGTEFPREFWTLTLVLALIIGATFTITRLSHWQLNPQSRIYRIVEQYAAERHHSRLVWQWLTVRNLEHPAFPLPMLIFFFCSALLSLILITLFWTNHPLAIPSDSISTFFSGLYHPLLLSFFHGVDGVFSAQLMYSLTLAVCIWLILHRHRTTALLIICAVALTECSLWIALGGSYTSTTGSWLNPEIMRISLLFYFFCGLAAHEIKKHHGWWLYALPVLPILLSITTQLYLQATTFTAALFSIGLAFTIASAALLMHRRSEYLRIVPNWILAILLLAGGLAGSAF